MMSYAMMILVNVRMSKYMQQARVSGRYGPTFQLLPSYSAGTNTHGTGDHTMPSRAGNISMTVIHDEVVQMFDHAFQGYMNHAFPMDDLRPISCTGSNSQGGIALTLLDSLDMLYMLKRGKELRKAVLYISKSIDFDIDVRVHVFEVTIRALGGLLSGHVLLSRDSTMVPWYRGDLLDKAVSLADRLLPAFDTPTGVPLSWINLRKGQIRGDTRITCTACAGTMLLEFGVLSRLTGNPIYEDKAKHAVIYLYNKRSVKGLLGNTFHVDKGEWVRRHAGIGAGIDSYYEYLLKAYLSFGDQEYLDMFADVYSSVQAYSALSERVNGMIWPVDVHMTSGRIVHPYVSALGAFWPGLQSLSGQFNDSNTLFWHWNLIAKKFRWIPEAFSPDLSSTHPQLKYYPLRPEFIESGYILYSDTGNPAYLVSIASFYQNLVNTTKTRCGFASISDVNTGRLEDSMESFFLSETVKYLYLMYSKADDIIDDFVLSTEAHFLPSFPGKSDLQRNHINKSEQVEGSCKMLCSNPRPFRSHKKKHTLPIDEKVSSRRILDRRCAVCKTLEKAVEEKKSLAMLQWRTGAKNSHKAPSTTVAPAAFQMQEPEFLSSTRFFLCLLLHVQNKNQMDCSFIREISLSDLSSQAFQALPYQVVIFQLKGSRRNEIDLNVRDVVEMQIEDVVKIDGVIANFGDTFFPGCLNSSMMDSLALDWRRKMDAEFIDDVEEELLYQHETELTNEEILERIKKKSLEVGDHVEPQGGETESSKEEAVTQEHGQSLATSMKMVPSCNVRGEIIVSEPLDGCSPLKNAESLRNGIVVMVRGGCSFTIKALHASKARAAAMVVIQQDGHAFQMDGSSSEYPIRIPCIMVGKNSGQTLLRSIGKQGKIWQPDWETRVEHTLHSLYGVPLSIISAPNCTNLPGYSGSNICTWESVVYEYQSDKFLHTEIIIPANQATSMFVMKAINELKSDFGPILRKLEGLLDK